MNKNDIDKLIPDKQSGPADFYLWGKDSTFDRNQPTYVLTHGWRSSPDRFQDISKSIKDHNPNANIILTDWSDSADNINYQQVANVTTKSVGKQLGEFLTDLGVEPDNTNLIGHSLGAHVSGIAGDIYDDLNNPNPVSTIIGLDPAGPSFEGLFATRTKEGRFAEKPEERLDPSDAQRVVALHSSTILGYDPPLADLDIYLNWDDSLQPGKSDFRGNHGYGIDLLADLYQGSSYAQDDGSTFELDDLFTLVGTQDISTTSIA